MLILIVLSNGSLDDKYRYLFMVYSNDNVATAADLRLLFGDLAKVGIMKLFVFLELKFLVACSSSRRSDFWCCKR